MTTVDPMGLAPVAPPIAIPIEVYYPGKTTVVSESEGSSGSSWSLNPMKLLTKLGAFFSLEMPAGDPSGRDMIPDPPDDCPGDDKKRRSRLALALSENLDDFAGEMNAMTWRDAPDADKWLIWVSQKIGDPNTQKLFLIEGIPGGPWAAAARGAAHGKKGYATDYEMHLVRTKGKSTQFYRGTPGNFREVPSVFR